MEWRKSKKDEESTQGNKISSLEQTIASLKQEMETLKANKCDSHDKEKSKCDPLQNPLNQRKA